MQGGDNLSDATINLSGSDGFIFANNFSKVVKDIMKSTLSVDLLPLQSTTDIEKSYPSYVTGMMVMQGKRDIVLTLTFSKVAAADTVVSLLGLKYTEIDEVGVYDAVMEMTNMVAGKLKSALIATGVQYTLTTPFVFVGKNHFMEPQSRPKGIVKRFKDRQFEMLGGVFFL